MKPSNLKEMDIIKRRDGQVCWVLKNEEAEELETFLPSLWGQHMLYHYNDDFTYGKDVKYFNPERDSRYDIVAVCRPRSVWKAISLMREYEIALKDGDESYFDEIMRKFNWIEVL